MFWEQDFARSFKKWEHFRAAIHKAGLKERVSGNTGSWPMTFQHAQYKCTGGSDTYPVVVYRLCIVVLAIRKMDGRDHRRPLADLLRPPGVHAFCRVKRVLDPIARKSLRQVRIGKSRVWRDNFHVFPPHLQRTKQKPTGMKQGRRKAQENLKLCFHMVWEILHTFYLTHTHACSLSLSFETTNKKLIPHWLREKFRAHKLLPQGQVVSTQRESWSVYSNWSEIRVESVLG